MQIRNFYLRLAVKNLIANRQIYAPYMLASIGTVTMFYMMHALNANSGIANIAGARDIRQILGFGTVVIAVFSVIFMLYINSFLIRQRQKEIGLLNVLGMGKKHIRKTMAVETLLSGTIILITGLINGMLFNRLFFMVMLRLMGYDPKLRLEIPPGSIIQTGLLFTGIFTLTLVINSFRIHLSNPAELLKGGQTGEQEPKAKWFITLIGILTLGAGYTLAQVIKSPLMAISLFFVAVLLVITGTYALFTSGSITALKLLRRNKDYYYQPKHFTAVSGMMYRMKQNAVGLASISILSAAVLIMLSTSLSLYFGVDDVLNTRFHHDAQVDLNYISPNEQANLAKHLHQSAGKLGIEITSMVQYSHYQTSVQDTGHALTPTDQSPYGSSGLYSLQIIPADSYSNLTGQSTTLDKDEILLFCNGRHFERETITVDTTAFTVKAEPDALGPFLKEKTPVFETVYMVVKDDAVALSLLNQMDTDTKAHLSHLFMDLNLNGREGAEAVLSLFDTIETDLGKENISHFDSRHLMKSSFYRLYGGLLFLGIFLGALFMAATALIIYYKQVTEGYDDKERFRIMQNVGMSHKEVKDTINYQIRLVFFLPLLTAYLHISMAFKMITRLLAVFDMVNEGLYLMCTIVTLLIFSIVYALVYQLTAKSYFRIVAN